MENFRKNNINNKLNIDKMRIIFLLNIILITAIIFSLTFGISCYKNNFIRFFYANLAIMIVFLISIIYLKITKNFYVTSEITLYSSIIFLLYAFLCGGFDNNGFVWSYIFPIGTIFILGLKKGNLFSIIYISIITSALYIPDFPFYTANYKETFKLRFIASLIIIHILSYFLEYSRLKAFNILIESEEKYRILIENANEGIAIVQDTKFKFVNDFLLNITGYTREEIIDQPFIKFFIKDDIEKVITKYKKMMSGEKKTFFSQYSIIKKDNSLLAIELNSTIIDYNSKPAVLAIFWDITEKIKLLEEKNKLIEYKNHSKKMESLGYLASNVAHDLNNMITIVKGFAELINKNLPDEEKKLKKFSQTIIRTTDNSSDILSSLATFARKGNFEMDPTNIHEIINNAVDLLTHTLEKNIKLEKMLNSSKIIINADNSQLQNALINLAMNAKDAMPNGGKIIFKTETFLIDNENKNKFPDDISLGEYILLSISDNGFGIKKEIQDKIFDPFFTTKMPGKGTGLGLSGVYGIIKDHKGYIEFNSKINVGTTFKIYLPVNFNNKIKLKNIIDTKNKTILIVDDEDDIRNMIADLLGSLGYKTIKCSNGIDAIKNYKKNFNAIDLILLDMIMPELDGYECFNKFKEINNELNVIIISGYSINNKIEEMIKNGAIGFLKKPFSLDEFSELVSSSIQ